LYVTQTVDTKHEVHINVIIGQNKRPVGHAVDFEIGQPIDKFQDTLVRSRMLPPINMGKMDFFLLPTTTHNSDGFDGSKLSKDEVLLDRQKTLFDYGVTSTSKNVFIRACVLVEKPLLAPVTNAIIDFPVVLNFLGALHAVTKSLSSEPATPTAPSSNVCTGGSNNTEDSVSILATPIPSAVVVSESVPIVSAMMTNINAKKRPNSSADRKANRPKMNCAGAKQEKGMFQGMKKGFLFSSSSETKEKASKLPKH